MRYREFLEKSLGNELPLPKGYHVVGHVALLTLSIKDCDLVREIGRLTLDYDSRLKSVITRSGPTTGITRKPEYVLIAGESDTLTTHVENGVMFRIDPLRLTFSGGNRRERIRLPERVKNHENVVDMFSCVGQFGLHIAVRTKANVVAIEINPEAFGFLEENIILNNVQDRMKAVFGDCRDVHPLNSADRVIMGFLHDTIKFLPAALETISPRGGWIHLHTSIPRSEVQDLCNTISTICLEYGYQSQIVPRVIKNYSPGIMHYVFDIRLTKD